MLPTTIHISSLSISPNRKLLFLCHAIVALRPHGFVIFHVKTRVAL
jgi:hypothetical protein